eukprot:801498-Amphidinium_carterae.1
METQVLRWEPKRDTLRAEDSRLETLPDCGSDGLSAHPQPHYRNREKEEARRVMPNLQREKLLPQWKVSRGKDPTHCHSQVACQTYHRLQ